MSKKNKFLNLDMGLVNENYIIINNSDKELWQSRGFESVKKYPVFDYRPSHNETIMLGKPLYIEEFGIENIINSKILETSTCCGTYGMGGPGFFGIKFQTNSGIRWLVYCIWNAPEHILLNDRVIECHPLFQEKYNPWLGHNTYKENMAQLDKIFSGSVIYDIQLTDTEITINFKNSTSAENTLCSYKYSDKFPEQGGTKRKRNSFENGTMKDYWLVTYDGTVLSV